MQINLSNLREITEKLFDHMEEIGITSLDVTDDFYWDIPKDQLYDPYNEPSKLDLGQLSDDWNDLQSVLNDEMEAISYNLVDLAAILRVIGQKIVV